MINESKKNELIKRQKETGLTITAFCRNEGIPKSSFYYWRKTLNRVILAPKSLVIFLLSCIFCLVSFIFLQPRPVSHINISNQQGSQNPIQRIAQNIPATQIALHTKFKKINNKGEIFVV